MTHRKPKPKTAAVPRIRRMVSMTLDPETIAIIDRIKDSNPSIESRSAAVREMARIAAREL